MGADTKIEWAAHTFNPWSGCTKVSPGCANCYAERQARRLPVLGNWGPGAERKRTGEANWRKPLKWEREASERTIAQARYGFTPTRPRVFCASLADWLDPEVPAEWLADLLALIATTPHLDWLLLTKRPGLWVQRMCEAEGADAEAGREFSVANAWRDAEQAPANVWLGTSVEDQQRADERIPLLLQIPARVRFLSCEPLLGPVDLEGFPMCQSCEPLGGRYEHVLGDDGATPFCSEHEEEICFDFPRGINWVICGGESGRDARPMHPDWARSLRDQCQAAGVAFHFKQWGAWSPSGKPKRQEDVVDGGGMALVRVGKHAAGRLLDGRSWDEVPA